MANSSYSVGTVSVSNGDTIIVGAGTIWSGTAARSGDRIYVDGAAQPVEIKDVTDPTHVTLWTPWSGGNKAAVPYIIVQDYPARVVGVAAAEDVGDLLAVLNAKGLLWYLSADSTDPTTAKITAPDGQGILQVSTGKLWTMDGGAWVFAGVFKGFGELLPWNSATDYQPFNLVSDAGSSYFCNVSNTNQRPPNATYWTLMAAKGDKGDIGTTGPAAWKPPVAWVTATAYVAGPPATTVTQGGETYVCLVSHTAGTFATDLAAGKWVKVAQKGADGTGVGTVTSVTVGGTTINSSGTLPAVAYDAAQSLTDAQKVAARTNVYAAPFDAMAYNGMQVNGHHDISQLNGSSAVSIASGSSSTYITDNWRFYKTGTSVLSLQRVASGIDGIPYALQATVTTAQATIGSDVALFGTWVEGSRFARAAWGTSSATPISVAFWFKAAAAGTYSLVAYNFDASSTQTASVVISAANTWTYCTATFAAKTSGTWKTDTSSGFEFQVVIAGGSSPNPLSGAPAVAAAITGLVILPGIELPSSAQLPRILRPADQELPQCLRLYEVQDSSESAFTLFGTGVCDSTTKAYFSFEFARKRILPTLSFPSTVALYGATTNGGGVAPATVVTSGLTSRSRTRIDFTAASGLTGGNGSQLVSFNSTAVKILVDARF